MPSPRRLLVPLLLCATLAHAAPPTTDWNAAARQDMQFAIDAIRSGHAGAVSGQLDVTAPLETGARAGLVEAAAVTSAQDYRRALVRSITIPSAIYTAFQPTRAPFVPDLPYPGRMADEPALMAWVAATLATRTVTRRNLPPDSSSRGSAPAP